MLNSELLDLWYAVRGKTPWHVRRNYEPKRMNEMPYRSPGGDLRADEIAELVRAIAANRRALVAELPAAETVSVRLDPALRLDVAERGTAKVHRADRLTLELRRGRRVVGSIRGEQARLDLLEAILGGKADEGVASLLLPKDLRTFATLVERRRDSVAALLAEGRDLVERVERLVCAVYDVPDDLTEQIVSHAVKRAAA